MKTDELWTEVLLRRAASGDDSAISELFELHSEQLRRMVAVRFDRRLSSRIDPADIIQDAFVDAVRKFADYAEQRPVPFYFWIRRLVWESLLRVYARHVRARRRSVTRESCRILHAAGAPPASLVDHLLDATPSPDAGLLQSELQLQMDAGLQKLTSKDRNVLTLRFFDQVSTIEIAATLGIAPGAVRVRLKRALHRLAQNLGRSSDTCPEQPFCGDIGQRQP